jgi:hypothetical protein
VARVQDATVQQQRFLRVLVGVVGASALVYPLLYSAVQLLFAQLLVVDVAAIVLWLAVGVTCSTGLVAVVRWGAARQVRSRWLLLGLLPPALYELWLVWPQLAS